MRQVLIGTTSGARLLDDAGSVLLGDQQVNWIAAADDGWWILCNADTVWYQPDSGPPDLALQLPDETLNCLLPVENELLIGAAQAKLWRAAVTTGAGQPSLRAAGIDLAFAEAPGRAKWYTPWGGPPDVRSLAADLDGTIYANVHVGGIVRLRPDGSWEATIDVDADVHQVVTHPERSGLVVAATARGLAVSTDGGDSWSFRTAGLHATYCRAVAVTGDTVFVSASGGPGGTLASLYRGALFGERLDRCTTGLPESFSTNLDTGCLAALPDLVVAADAAGVVYGSTDRGETWETLALDLPSVTALALR